MTEILLFLSWSPLGVSILADVSHVNIAMSSLRH